MADVKTEFVVTRNEHIANHWHIKFSGSETIVGYLSDEGALWAWGFKHPFASRNNLPGSDYGVATTKQLALDAFEKRWRAAHS
jgi:hypothetical protein